MLVKLFSVWFVGCLVRTNCQEVNPLLFCKCYSFIEVIFHAVNPKIGMQTLKFLNKNYSILFFGNSSSNGSLTIFLY